MRRWMQFSKKVIIAMVILWFVGALFGMFMVYKSGSDLSYLLDYIGSPVSGSIIGYLLKAGVENAIKEYNSRKSGNAVTQETYSTPQPDPIYSESFPT